MKEKNTLVILDIHKEIERETRGREYEGGGGIKGNWEAKNADGRKILCWWSI